ncbi:MAG: hypothetical protein M3186_11275 [Actinomycetota bacterium]|nr:hypothetical protein [Actinomycetota bacterium]
MSASHTVRQSLVLDVEALVSAIMEDAPVEKLIPIVGRLAEAVDHWDEIPQAAVAELRSAVDLMRGGQACATVSALLAARSELNTPPD